MRIRKASADVPEDDKVLGLASGGDQVWLAVTIKIGGLKIFDGHLLRGNGARAPSLARIVERREQADAGIRPAPANHGLA